MIDPKNATELIEALPELYAFWVANQWQPIETAPRDGSLDFAVAVYSVPYNGEASKFIRWDIWTDDASDDWEDEREIGWRMADATMWRHTTPPPEPGKWPGAHPCRSLTLSRE